MLPENVENTVEKIGQDWLCIQKIDGEEDAEWGPYVEREFADRVKGYLDEGKFDEAKSYDEVYEENREEIEAFLAQAKASGLIKPSP